jgi:MinD-like ATPase involved in chromosome partitioning or flagellar assembly
VLKRCVDVDDLLATAAAGQAEVAVVSLDAPGLDAAAVDHLRRYRVRPVGVVDALSAGRGESRAESVGITSLVGSQDLASLASLVEADVAEAALAAGGEGEGEPTAPPVSGGGRSVVVWGPQGAPGRTTLAVSFAAELAGRGQRTLLVDADPYGGAVSQQLGVLDEISGLLAASRLSSGGGLEDRFATVQRALGPKLGLVSGLPRTDRWVEVRAGVIEHLIEVAAARGHVVVDTGFSLEQSPGAELGSRPGRNTMTLGALTVADEVLVVGAADPVGLARLARGLVELREVIGATPVRVVVNRARPSLGWSEREVAGMVEGFGRVLAVHFLPEDRPAVDRALVAGRSLVETGESPLRRAVSEVVDAVLPATVDPPGRRVRRRTAGRVRPR